VKKTNVKQIAKELHTELTELVTSNWLHGVCVSDDKTLITVHVSKKSALEVAGYYKGWMIEFVVCGGPLEPCIWGVGKGNIPG